MCYDYCFWVLNPLLGVLTRLASVPAPHSTQPIRTQPIPSSLQCLEISSADRAALLRLNESLLDPDGFCPLRASAGIRLKRRANPTGGGGGGGGGGGVNGDGSGNPRHRRHRSAIERAVAVGAAPSGSSDLRLPLPDGIARLKAISTLSAWSDAKANSAAATANGGGGGSAGSSSALVVRAGSSVSNSNNNDGDDDDDDDYPPLLDALERGTAGGGDGGGSSSKDRGASTTRLGGSLPLFTPKRQSTTVSLSWGATSPWMPGSAQRSEQGWLSRLALAGSQTPPANSSAAAAAAGAGAGSCLLYTSPSPRD